MVRYAGTQLVRTPIRLFVARTLWELGFVVRAVVRQATASLHRYCCILAWRLGEERETERLVIVTGREVYVAEVGVGWYYTGSLVSFGESNQHAKRIDWSFLILYSGESFELFVGCRDVLPLLSTSNSFVMQ